MKRRSARPRCFCPNFFSADKHWVFILLVASNFVLFSLVFVLLNQDQAVAPTYVPAQIKTQISLSPTVVTTKSASVTAAPTVAPIPTARQFVPEIKRLLNLIFTGQQPMTLNANGINSFTPDNLQFFDEETQKNIYYVVKISSYEYVPGTTLVNIVDGKKYSVSMDKWVSWLTGIKSGKQDSLVYSDLGQAAKSTSVVGRKIGSNIFYINDYKKNTGWIREYTTYDSIKKQIVKVVVGTSEPGGFSANTLTLFSQIEASFAAAK